MPMGAEAILSGANDLHPKPSTDVHTRLQPVATYLPTMGLLEMSGKRREQFAIVLDDCERQGFPSFGRFALLSLPASSHKRLNR